MLDAIKELQAPALVALLIMLYMLLKYMTEQRKDFTDTFKRLHEEHLEARLNTLRESQTMQATLAKLGDAMTAVAVAVTTCPLKAFNSANKPKE